MVKCSKCNQREAVAFFGGKEICGYCWEGRKAKKDKPSESKFMKELIMKYGRRV